MRVNKMWQAVAVSGVAAAGVLGFSGTALADDGHGCGGEQAAEVCLHNAEVAEVVRQDDGGEVTTFIKFEDLDEQWIAGPDVDASGIDPGDIVDAAGVDEGDAVHVLEITEQQ
ncbi:MAG: hypothetical protein ACRDXX_07930 [Stackebrandtia sp.]